MSPVKLDAAGDTAEPIGCLAGRGCTEGKGVAWRPECGIWREEGEAVAAVRKSFSHRWGLTANAVLNESRSQNEILTNICCPPLPSSRVRARWMYANVTVSFVLQSRTALLIVQCSRRSSIRSRVGGQPEQLELELSACEVVSNLEGERRIYHQRKIMPQKDDESVPFSLFPVVVGGSTDSSLRPSYANLFRVAFVRLRRVHANNSNSYSESLRRVDTV
ncbi:hypothetical protein C8F04DRAFT_1095958 [Mycena alexandri]|uniref:Uncharacterized protein n=1 Tax=Mycena alexandri TaxID=1745969 RepID=A0AAD6X618_9AGAR|nr:hypothetical protein C8F04DRAFT_1095958 [Mycena alexandri]